MKKMAVILLCFSMLCAASVTASAQVSQDSESGQAVIGTEVPASHIINVTLIGSGSYDLDGETGSSFEAQRLSQPMLSIKPDSGWEITSVTLNGSDITEEVSADGQYIFEPVYEDKTVVITLTGQESSAPDPSAPDSSSVPDSSETSSSSSSVSKIDSSTVAATGGDNPATGVIGGVSIGSAVMFAAFGLVRKKSRDKSMENE